MNRDQREKWIDRVIREAQERGFFENLEGAGRPINWEDEALVDDEWALAFRLMREQGFAPEWIELHKEIDAELDQARKAVARAWRWRQERLLGAREAERRYVEGEWGHARTIFAETIAELNKKIADFNLKVPVARLQKFKFSVDEELAALEVKTGDL